jgi:hypothetical protein
MPPVKKDEAYRFLYIELVLTEIKHKYHIYKKLL